MGYAYFSPKQRKVLTWWMPGNSDYGREAIVCDGAVRSGKTLAMGLGFFLWAMTCFDGKRFGVCGKTIASLRRNVLSEILPRLKALGADWKEKRTENLVTVTFKGHRNQFYIFGGRDESSASLISRARACLLFRLSQITPYTTSFLLSLLPRQLLHSPLSAVLSAV